MMVANIFCNYHNSTIPKILNGCVMEQCLLDKLRESVFLDWDDLQSIDTSFALYYEFLKKWNQVFNLISRTGPSLEHHLFDSLHYLKAIPREGRFLDIGSGAGFPGIPLKIVLPYVRMELLECQRKRANFLRSLICTLNMKNIVVIHNRAEELHQELNFQKQFDVVLFRGVGKLVSCLSLGQPFLKLGGVLIIKQSPKILCPRELQGMELDKEIPVKGLRNMLSKLMVFKKIIN